MKEKGFAHILLPLVLLVGIVIGVVLVQQQTNIFSKAFSQDPIDRLTNQLLEIDNQYNQTLQQTAKNKAARPQADNQLMQMANLARIREEQLLQKMKDNPQEFINKATLVDKIDKFPETIRPYLEQKVSPQGKLTVIHGDNFETKKSSYRYFLTVGKGGKNNTYSLFFVKNLPSLLSDSEIRIAGIGLNQQVALQDGGGSSNALQVVSAATTSSSGEQKTAIFLVNFSDDPNKKPITLDKMRSLIFGINNPSDTSVNQYYQENSFNKVNFTGDIFGWYTITSGDCKDSYYRNFFLGDWENQANAAAKAAGVNLSGYSRLLYFFPTNRGCDDPGVLARGEVGGNPSRADFYNSQSSTIYMHELGHNLGSHHANSLECGTLAINTYNLCTEREYGDRFDVMGSIATPILQFNGPHKVGFGWIPDSNIKKISSNGTYTIYDSESLNSGPQILQIPKPDSNEYYFISYRQKKGLDTNLPDGMTKGASIHIWNNSIYRQTRLIDTNPGIITNFDDAALYDGAVFNDLINNISIKQVSHTNSNDVTNGSVTLQIDFNSQQNPNPTPTPSPKLISSWQNLSSVLPTPLIDHSAVSSNGYLFIIGGWGNSGPQSTIYSAKINNDGTTGSWTELKNTPLPQTLNKHSSVVANGYIFVMGGSGGQFGQAQSTVYSAKINNDGSLGNWTELKNTPLPKELVSHASIFVNGYIVVSGGENYASSPYVLSSIYIAKVNNDGTLGNWTELKNTPMPVGLSNHALAISGGYIFALGGKSVDGSIQSAVYSTKVNNDGSLGNWTELKNTPLLKNLMSLSVIGYQDYLFVTGGYNLYSGVYNKEAYHSKVQSDGSLNGWVADVSLPNGLSRHAATIVDSRLFVIGGQGLVGGVSISKSLDTVYSGLINLPILPSPSPIPSPIPSPTPSQVTQQFQIDVGQTSVGLIVVPSSITNSQLRSKLRVASGFDYKAEDFLTDLNSSFQASDGSRPGNAINRIYWFDPSRGDYIVHLFKQADGSNFNIVGGQAYFIGSTVAGKASLTGVSFVTTSFDIPKYWSSISFSSLPDSLKTADDLLSNFKNQGIDIREIDKWQNGKFIKHVSGDNSTNFSIIIGEGYAIRNYGVAKQFTIPVMNTL